jgi:glycosyltransferase involved in cell wall biosynthesis
MSEWVRSIAIPVFRFTPSGGTRVLCRFATEWKRRGIDVDFIVLDPASQPTFETQAKVVPAHTLHADAVVAPPSLAAPALEIVALARALRAASSSYDVFLGNHGFTSLACALGGVRRRTLYYVQAYDPEILAKKRRLKSYVAAGLAALSYLACRQQVANSPHYIGYPLLTADSAVPPGVDTAVFRPKEVPGHLPAEGIRIGIIGRAEPHKYRPVLNAFRAIHQRHPDVKLCIAYGNIPEHALADCGEPELVRPQSDAELAAFYRHCDVFLALTEFPQGAFYPPLEALASGTVLISNRFLHVRDNNSWPVRDAAEVADAFDALLAAGPEVLQRKATRGIDDVRSSLSWPVLAGDLLKKMNTMVRGEPVHSTL